MTEASTLAPSTRIVPSAKAQLSWEPEKESKLKSRLEITENEGVLVVRCRGRIVYRDEAAALFGEVIRLLPGTSQFVLDLSQVEMMDGAGLGELVILLTRAQAAGSAMKIADPSKCVRELLDLTNLSSIFEIYPTVEDAVQSCRCEVA